MNCTGVVGFGKLKISFKNAPHLGSFETNIQCVDKETYAPTQEERQAKLEAYVNLPNPIHKIESLDDFNTFKADNSVCIVDAFATWCPPCVRITPAFVTIGRQFMGKSAFAKFDVDKSPDVKAAVSIKCMPTFIVFKDGVEVDRIEGADEQKIIDVVTKHSA